MYPKIVNKKEIGKTFEIGKRKFYPVIQISTTEADNYFAESVTPLALVVFEDNKKYILPLKEDVDTEEINKINISK